MVIFVLYIKQSLGIHQDKNKTSDKPINIHYTKNTIKLSYGVHQNKEYHKIKPWFSTTQYKATGINQDK